MSERVLRIAAWLVAAWLSVDQQAVYAQPQAAPPEHQTAANAALAYWQAFAVLPPLKEAQLKLMDSAGLDVLTDEQRRDDLRQLLKDSAAALRLLHAAAAMEHCDWQVVPAGPATLLPHLSKARTLARLALLRARHRAVSGDAPGAVADVLACYRLGRHIRGVLVESLVSLAIERQANQAVREILPRLDQGQCRSLRAAMDSLPQRASFAETILAERDMFGGWLWEQSRDGRLAERLAELDDVDLSELAQWFALGAVNQAALRDLVQYYNRVAELSRQPQAAEKLAEEERQMADAANPLIRTLMPAVSRAFESFGKAEEDFEQTRQTVARQAGNP